MKFHFSQTDREPAVAQLLTELADKDRELAELRSQAMEKEHAFRQAQERLNDLSRDRMYWAASTLRKIAVRFQWIERVLIGLGAVKRVVGLVLATLLVPVRALLGGFGLSRRRAIERETSQSYLRVGCVEPLPETLTVGRGTCLMVSGWAFHPFRRVAHLELRLIAARPEPVVGECVDGKRDLDVLNDEERGVEFFDLLVPVIVRNLPSREILSDHFRADDPNGNSYRSGFLAELVLPAIPRSSRAQLFVRARLDDGTIESAPLGRLVLEPCLPAARNCDSLPVGKGPLVAVCMTTYNPPAELFRKQIESIRAQTHERWICLIRDDGSNAESKAIIEEVLGDDSRFRLLCNSKNLGFYKNFETVLADVPAEVDYIALSDQDDAWHRDKLESLLLAFTPATMLTYSDMNIVDRSGKLLSNTYWTTRVTNHDNYADLLLANTITGAASMFRRTLLDYLLPFPQKFGDAYHDQWLATVATALGRVGFVNRPLYDYVQHGQNVIGHFAPKPPSLLGRLYRFVTFMWPPNAMRRTRDYFERGRQSFSLVLLRMQYMARVALVRCGHETVPEKRQALENMLAVRSDWKRQVWLGFRPLLKRDSWRATLGIEHLLLQCIAWRTWHRFCSWWGTRLAAAGVLRAPLARRLVPRSGIVEKIPSAMFLERKTAAITLAIHEDSPRRVNLVISMIDFRYVFGGYITVFNLAKCLAERGHRVRLVIVDECDYRPVAFAANFRNYPGLEDFLDRIELIYVYDRSTVVHVNPHDVFLPTSWWTAHVAHKATTALGKEKFVYLIQEFEPGFYPLGTIAALSAESYTFPHYAVFSTELLREYFRINSHGVFALPDGDAMSESFQNTITAVGRVTAADLRGRRKRRLLYYARPEDHAARNMFDIGLMALRRAVERGAFAGWEFHGIGALSSGYRIKLGDDANLELLPRHDQESYRKILKQYDVGMSLMCSPHPSLVPIEMCSAGMLTVTNTYANKTAEKLSAISENFVAVDPTIESVTAGLLTAHATLDDIERRLRGSAVNWATEWDQSFNRTVMTRLEEFIEAASRNTSLKRECLSLRVA